MEALYPNEYCQFKKDKKKIPLLKKFKKDGFFLIDACEYPINKKKKSERQKRIA